MRGDINGLWFPERIFYSHASQDKEITDKVCGIINKMIVNSDIFVSEHKTNGKQLLGTLKQEMLNCNAIFVAWTKSCVKKSTSQIISFEVGMAFSLGLPIYILQFGKATMPWFFQQIAKIEQVTSNNLVILENRLARVIDFSNCIHPVDVIFKKEKHPEKTKLGSSENDKVVQSDGSLVLSKGFKGVLHYWLINNRKRTEKSVRITIDFPEGFVIDFDQGKTEASKGETQKHDLFHLFKPRENRMTIDWPRLSPEGEYLEVYIDTTKASPGREKAIVKCSTDSLVTVREKHIPITVTAV